MRPFLLVSCFIWIALPRPGGFMARKSHGMPFMHDAVGLNREYVATIDIKAQVLALYGLGAECWVIV